MEYGEAAEESLAAGLTDRDDSRRNAIPACESAVPGFYKEPIEYGGRP